MDRLIIRLSDGTHQISEWNDFTSFPPVKELDDSIISVLYSAEREKELLDWCKRCDEYAYNNDVSWPMTYVWADYGPMSGGEVAACVSRFADAGAMFVKIPEGLDFHAALKDFARDADERARDSGN